MRNISPGRPSFVFFKLLVRAFSGGLEWCSFAERKYRLAFGSEPFVFHIADLPEHRIENPFRGLEAIEVPGVRTR